MDEHVLHPTRALVAFAFLFCGLAPGLASASSLDTALIDRTVREKSAAIAVCYEEGLARRPKLSGKIVVLFTVENDGSVSDAVTKKGTTLHDEAVTGCVLDEFRTLIFPGREDVCDASKQDCTVKITYPLTFTP